MRASYIPHLEIQESYLLKGDVCHHLVNVVRIESGEELLLLNGVGLKVKTQVTSVNKKEIHLKTISHERVQRTYVLDLALGIPKKEAFELCLKEAVELGFQKLYLVRAQYSQIRIPESDRLMSLLISALEQSNAPFLPQIIQTIWKDIPMETYQEVVLMDSQNPHNGKLFSAAPRLLIVGPEGGFSPEEMTIFSQQKNLKGLHLPTPILRTPTALATGAGILLGTLLD